MPNLFSANDYARMIDNPTYVQNEMSPSPEQLDSILKLPSKDVLDTLNPNQKSLLSTALTAVKGFLIQKQSEQMILSASLAIAQAELAAQIAPNVNVFDQMNQINKILPADTIIKDASAGGLKETVEAVTTEVTTAQNSSSGSEEKYRAALLGGQIQDAKQQSAYYTDLTAKIDSLLIQLSA